MERIELALKQMKRVENYQFAVLFIDLDRFKLVNESLGHLAGDQLLIAIANLLESCLRATDTVARLGGEALIRWQHPRQGLICPNEFICIAEDSGLIIPMGEWVLREACGQLKAWQEQYVSAVSLTISVNLASKQIKHSQFIWQLDQILAETQLDGNCLKLEITESMLIEITESATATFSNIRDRKVQLSIDDFGTGYSSLSYLNRFPINTLKIDRSFVSQMGSDNQDLSIIRAIITLAHTLGMDVIAEGVETAEQRDQLSLLKCEFGQGYFFSQPLDAKSVEALL